jgi:adenosylmethionine-8-amino-7-oxononanoate aminotransferase
MGHPVAAAAGLAVVSAILDRGLVARVRSQGARLAEALRAEFGAHSHVGDIRGRGLFMGLEFVADRESKAPFDPARRLAPRLKHAAFDAGLICYPMGGTIDGRTGDHVLLAPPFVISDDEIDSLVGMLGTALKVALAS